MSAGEFYPRPDVLVSLNVYCGIAWSIGVRYAGDTLFLTTYIRGPIVKARTGTGVTGGPEVESFRDGVLQP